MCTGDETDLLACQHNMLGDTECAHLDDVSITCHSSDVSPSFAASTTIPPPSGEKPS